MKTFTNTTFAIFCFLILNFNRTKSSSDTEINVEYNINPKCKDCPNWILIKGNYKSLNIKKAKRIYIQNQNTLEINELDYLFEKQKPLTLILMGKFSETKKGDFEIFIYSKYTMVEF